LRQTTRLIQKRVTPPGTLVAVPQPLCEVRSQSLRRYSGDADMLSRITRNSAKPRTQRGGSVFVEYVLLVTIVGIGVIVGLACVREALINELVELANAINAITP